MSSINDELIKSINEFINSQSSTVDKKELFEVIKDVFTKHKKSKKGGDDTVEKQKRKPSAYNLFMKKTMEELKNNGMTAKEKMKRVADLWKEFKNSPQKNEEIIEDAEEEEVQVKEQEPEPETEAKKVKKNNFKKK